MNPFKMTLIAIYMIILNQLSAAKIVQLTETNIPLLLQQTQSITTLLHHPKCQISSNYKGRYIKTVRQIEHKGYNDQIVAIIDCSILKHICDRYNSQKKNQYPLLVKITDLNNSQVIDQQEYLYDTNKKLEQPQKVSQTLKSKRIVSALKNKPNYIIILFQEIGMPIPQYYRNTKVFYLQNNQQKLVTTLSSFVGHRGGCWIFLNSQNQFALKKYFCGNAYQSVTDLKNLQQKFERQLVSQYKTQITFKQLIWDNSNYDSMQVLGYKQLIYKLQHFELELQKLPIFKQYIVPHKCFYVYLWSKQCQYCNKQIDMEIIKGSLNTYIGKQRPMLQKYSNYEVMSYNIDENKAIWQQEAIKNIMKGQKQSYSQQMIRQKNNAMTLVPNIISICLNAKQNEQFQLHAPLLNKFISHQNVYRFIDQIQKQYIKHINVQNSQEL